MTVTEISLQDQITTEQAAEAAAALQDYLREHPASPTRLRLGESPEGEKSILVPAVAFALFAGILQELAAGHSVTVAVAQAEVTTQQAADLLNVSRPFLIGLLEKQQIPYRRVGNRRKILLADLLEYKQRDDNRRHALLDELAAEAQELGLYD